ncbi:MAG: deoxyhypusine synthase family protein [Planctomycetota bacterium]
MRMREFMDLHYRHFNARETRDAAAAWVDLLKRGGKMFLTLGGAMSTAELGISLAKMIREGKVHGISCTGANLEEDLFNLVAHESYKVLPHYRDLTPQDETALYEDRLNRVTDTCIPEQVMRNIDARLLGLWQNAGAEGRRHTPWEFVRQLVADGSIAQHYEIPAERSWVLAAHEMDLPVFVPGWEDSTLGNTFTAYVIRGKVQSHSIVKSGTEQMDELATWYREQAGQGSPVGFFQVGGGIAGDFPICVVPMIIQDLKQETPFWAYFCQIGDSVTSYGSYSGAVPNEKISWGKLEESTPRFMINSDATLVAPLIFAYVLDE